MRIVYLVESLQPAGAERVVMELARAESSEGCAAEIITLRETPASGGGQCPDIRHFPLFRQGEFHWPGSAPRAAWRLRRKLLQLRPDVLAIHTPKAALVAALAGVKIPTLWVLHGHDVCWDGATAWRRLSRGLQRWTLSRLRARVAAVSASLAEHAAEGLGMAREEIAVVPNGVDITRFRFEEKIPTNDVVVCMLGRLVPWKGPWQALEAFSWLMKRFPVARLWFVGDGPMRDELAAVVEALGWEHAVTFWGMLEHPEERLRQATVLWMPTESEGLPVACVEAMATGTPVLGFDVRGVRDLLQEGCGVLVPPQDARELAAQTARLVRDERSYGAVARAARARVESGYSCEQMRAGHMQLMRALCTREPAACQYAFAIADFSPQETRPEESRN
jgi:glycosyltransferase involved in cell wall biosynthesis